MNASKGTMTNGDGVGIDDCEVEVWRSEAA